jgi:hypothetical protein
VLCHQTMSSTFEFLHTCYRKSLSGAYRGGKMFVLKSCSPLYCQFLHLFLVYVFRIINSLLRCREISQVVCLRATSQGEHKLVWWFPKDLCILMWTRCIMHPSSSPPPGLPHPSPLPARSFPAHAPPPDGIFFWLWDPNCRRFCRSVKTQNVVWHTNTQTPL